MRGNACNSQLCIRHGNARFAKHKSHFHHCLNPTSLVKKAREKSEHRESSWLVRWLFCGPMAVLRNSDCSGCWNLTGWLEPPSQWLLVGAVGRRHSYPGFLRGELVIKCEKGAHQAYLIYTVVVLLGFLSTLMYTSGIPRHTIFFSRDGWGRLLGASAPGRGPSIGHGGLLRPSEQLIARERCMGLVGRQRRGLMALPGLSCSHRRWLSCFGLAWRLTLTCPPYPFTSA